jgi:hypothetical protein
METFAHYYVAHGGSEKWGKDVTAWTVATDPHHPLVRKFLEERQHTVPHVQREFLKQVRDAWDNPVWLFEHETGTPADSVPAEDAPVAGGAAAHASHASLAAA